MSPNPQPVRADWRTRRSALDTFREQRAAAGGVYAALQETSELVRGVQSQVNALTRIDELKALGLRTGVRRSGRGGIRGGGPTMSG